MKERDEDRVSVKMPHRNSTNREPPNSVIALRRSPRLLQKGHPPPEAPKTPDPISHKGSLKKTLKHRSEKNLKKVEESKSGSNFSDKLCAGSGRSASLNGGFCLRRSPRFSGNRNTPDECVENSSKEIVAKTEKRVTRSCSRGNANGCVKMINKVSCSGFMKNATTEVSDEEDLPGAKVGGKHFGSTLEKRKARSSGANKGLIKSASSIGVFDVENFSDVQRAKVGANSCKKFGGKLEKRTRCGSGASSVVIGGGEEKEESDLEKGMEKIGVKRKRNQVEEGHGCVQGWSKDQELALQRAYFSAKPTPQFWKKVAKLVPGKSAKDCFNKVHADHLTPPQPRTRLRAPKTISSSFSLSASTLLKPTQPKTRRPNGRKQKSHLLQKTVRELLQKHYAVDQNQEADLFAVLESTFSPSTHKGVTHYTPEREQEKPGYVKECHERSSSAHKKHLSRLSSSNGAALVSPPVLKQVKNKALHEKYIDQLHCREAKRRAASSRAAKILPGKENRKESYIQKVDAIKAAKDALVFDAKDVIHQFQHVKVSALSNYSDINDDGVESDDDEVEDEP